jgi:hypothetical protein
LEELDGVEESKSGDVSSARTMKTWSQMIKMAHIEMYRGRNTTNQINAQGEQNIHRQHEGIVVWDRCYD